MLPRLRSLELPSELWVGPRDDAFACELLRHCAALLDYLVWHYARRYRRLTLDEIRAELSLALITAGLRYDPAFNPDFGHYALFRCDGAVKDYIRALGFFTCRTPARKARGLVVQTGGVSIVGTDCEPRGCDTAGQLEIEDMWQALALDLAAVPHAMHVLKARYVEGKRTGEIAAELGLPAGRVDYLFGRIRMRLRALHPWVANAVPRRNYKIRGVI